MRLFKNLDASATAMEKPQQHASAKKNKNVRAPKPQLSASEIRDKVKEHFAPKPPPEDKVDVSAFSKIKNSEQQKVEEKVEDKKLSKPSDVGLNDPNDPETVGKLKSVLSKGAFNFNDREREALEKILADRD